jgi:hypothetical protein
MLRPSRLSFTLPFWALLSALPADAWALGKVGNGSGLPYGTPLVGLGVELDLGPYVAALGGVGVGNYETPWAAGLRVSLAPAGKKWRPHLTGMHWTEGNGFYRGAGVATRSPEKQRL